MAFPWGAVISAGAGVLGKLFGKQEQPRLFPSEKALTRHLENIVQAAEASGFNPLTVLGSSVAGVTSGMGAPALSQSSEISDIFGGISQFFASYDPQAEKRAQLEFDLVQAQLDNLQADTAQRLRSFEVPTSTGARVVGADGRPLGNDGGVMRGLGGAVKWNVNPINTPAQVMEDQYGEIPAAAIGAGNWVDDALTTWTGVRGPVEAGEKIRKRLKEWWETDIPTPKPRQNPALPMGWSPQQLFNMPWD